MKLKISLIIIIFYNGLKIVVVVEKPNSGRRKQTTGHSTIGYNAVALWPLNHFNPLKEDEIQLIVIN